MKVANYSLLMLITCTLCSCYFVTAEEASQSTNIRYRSIYLYDYSYPQRYYPQRYYSRYYYRPTYYYYDNHHKCHR